MRAWVAIGALVVAAIVAGVVLAAGGGTSNPGVTSSPAVNATHAPHLPQNVYALPDVTYDDFTRLLRELRGTPVVVYVWGSWCGPCREDGPRVAAAARRYGRRVQFIGLDVKDFDKGPARGFIHQMGWTFPNLFDPTPTADVETGLGFLAQPVTLFYSRAGSIVDQVSGPASKSDLAQGIGKIVA